MITRLPVVGLIKSSRYRPRALGCPVFYGQHLEHAPVSCVSVLQANDSCNSPFQISPKCAVVIVSEIRPPARPEAALNQRSSQRRKNLVSLPSFRQSRFLIFPIFSEDCSSLVSRSD